MNKLPDMPKIVIDTREQKPYKFKNSIKAALCAGDYSLVGYEDKVTVERKSKADAYGSLSGRVDKKTGRNNRERFEREFIRLTSYEFAAIVIECSLKSFIKPPRFSKLNPTAAINTLISWSIRYNIHLHFAGDRRHGMAMTHKLLRHYWRNKILYTKEGDSGNTTDQVELHTNNKVVNYENGGVITTAR